jgi:hypothetical protein
MTEDFEQTDMFDSFKFKTSLNNLKYNTHVLLKLLTEPVYGLHVSDFSIFEKIYDIVVFARLQFCKIFRTNIVYGFGMTFKLRVCLKK